jgi:hypothetical protein
MEAYRSGQDWFSDLFGFEEGSSYEMNRAGFTMDGEVLVCPTAPNEFRRQYVGPCAHDDS